MTDRLSALPKFELTRVDSPEGRLYNTSLGALSSVTTILEGSRDNTKLQQWREYVGEERAEFITSLACFRGNAQHSNIERFLLDGTEPSFDFLTTPYWKSTRAFLKTIVKPLLLEGAIWHHAGYAGTLDCIAYLPEDDHQPTLLDWKTADSPRKPDKIYEYSLQCAAYVAGANYVYANHNLKIQRAKIVVAISDSAPQIVSLGPSDLEQLYKHFQARLERFTFSRSKK